VLQAFPLGGCGAPTCAPLWTSTQVEWYPRAAPMVAGGVVYVITEFRLAAFPAAGCGAARCPHLTNLDVSSGPASVAEGKVFVSTWSGNSQARVQAFAPAG
jgi:outer membrane protein assembly factor BamB